MQKVVDYIQHQMVQNARMHMVKHKSLYMYQSYTTTADSKWNWWNRVELMNTC